MGDTKPSYAVLMVDGPGQGSALYEKGLAFRHDYEAVFGAILDFAAERPEVDDERIALSERTFGGYLAPLAACFERRAGAVIADPGQYDLGAQVRSMLPPQLWAQVEASAPEAEEKFAEMLESACYLFATRTHVRLDLRRVSKNQSAVGCNERSYEHRLGSAHPSSTDPRAAPQKPPDQGGQGRRRG
ncbi:MAG TPA: hypothetical protein VFH20_03785 [Propionibacteriaceae bacterium]|nr:hypothetical protein [Propionibacteriaceae bacterium]